MFLFSYMYCIQRCYQVKINFHRTINNYIIWFTIDKYIGFLNSSFIKAKSKVEKDTFGVDKVSSILRFSCC